ncbi:MAG: ABC transporter permease family protein, partial [Microbacteriaceae bacterium]
MGRIGGGGFRARLRRARLAIRIARRSSVRSPGRSALIVALIALPVAGMAAVTLVIPSTMATTAERIAVELGHAQARVQVIAPPGTGLTQDPLSNGWGGGSPPGPGNPALRKPGDLFPAGTSLVPVLDTAVTVTTRTGVAVLPAVEGRPWDPALAGRYDLVAGRAPAAAGEVMATASALHRLGLALGQEARLVAPIAHTVTVVGVLSDRMIPAATAELFGTPGAFTGRSDILGNSRTILYLPSLTLDWQQVQQLNTQGAVVLSRQVLEHPPASTAIGSGAGGSSLTGFLSAAMLFGFAVLEVTLLAGAAFTVGARAQERSLAIVAGIGSTRSTIFSIITASGLVLGLLGGIVGVGLGIAAGSAFMTWTTDGSATRYWGYHLWWPAMIGIVLLALVIGWLGALVPGIRGSKFDVVAALRGARRPPVPRRRRPIAGVVAVTIGIALTLAGGGLIILLFQSGRYTSPLIGVGTGLLIGGPILAQLGLILCSGLLLRLLARLLSRAGVAARLASRDAARNPGRSVPALAVVMTTVFGAVFAMTAFTSFEVTARAHYEYSTMPGQVQVPLHYWGPQPNEVTAFPHPGEVVSAVNRTLGISTARALASVPDAPFTGGPTVRPATNPSVLLPELTVPAVNQCPSDPTSLNFSKATTVPGSAAQRTAQADWRCQSSYVLSGQSDDGRGHIWVGTAADLALVLGSAPSQAAKDALAGGGAVSLYPEYIAAGKATVSWWLASHWTQAGS